MRSLVTRFCRLVCLLLALIALVPAAMTARAQDASPASGAAPLDLAAMALTPDDLADLGLADFLIADGRTQSLEDRVAQQAADDGDDPDEVRRSLSELGWTRGYRSRLVHPLTSDSEDFDALVSSGVIQFDDSDGARSGWGLISQLDFISGEATPTAGSQTIGDRSQLLDLGEVTLDGTTHPGLRLIFQHGALVGDIIVYAAPGQPLATADIEALAERQIERMDEVLADGGPQLSFKILRWGGLGLSDPDVDNYLKFDGTHYVGLGDTEQDIATATATYADATDYYRYEAALTETLFQTTSVAQFPTADVAVDWVDGAEARTAKNLPAEATLERVTDVPSFGDESVVLKVTSPIEEGEATGYAVFASMGDQAISFGLIALGDLDAADFTAMATDQLACFEAGSCTESMPLPTWASA
ncbi:MAG: hypothetical protein QOF73_2285 [Thermomicrobiales bacterium]|nr:hypothetical protein [Thermomicrobiales bacterium]